MKIRFLPEDFRNGDYRFDSYFFSMPSDIEGGKSLDGWYIECELPCLPPKDSAVMFDNVDVYAQLSAQIGICERLKCFILKWWNDNKDTLIHINSIDEALKEFCDGKDAEGFREGFWYVSRHCFFANDEYVYIEMNHSL